MCGNIRYLNPLIVLSFKKRVEIIAKELDFG